MYKCTFKQTLNGFNLQPKSTVTVSVLSAIQILITRVMPAHSHSDFRSSDDLEMQRSSSYLFFFLHPEPREIWQCTQQEYFFQVTSSLSLSRNVLRHFSRTAVSTCADWDQWTSSKLASSHYLRVQQYLTKLRLVTKKNRKKTWKL